MFFKISSSIWHFWLSNFTGFNICLIYIRQIYSMNEQISEDQNKSDWLTQKKLTNSNQVRTLVNFCESGAVRKLLLWIIYGYTLYFMGIREYYENL